MENNRSYHRTLSNQAAGNPLLFFDYLPSWADNEALWLGSAQF